MNREENKKLIFEVFKWLISPLMGVIVSDLLSGYLKLSPFILSLVFIFWGCWFFIGLFLLISKTIVKYNDNKQFRGVNSFPYISPTYAMSSWSRLLDEIKGFRWSLKFQTSNSINPSNYKKNKDFDLNEITMNSLKGPYCPIDFCEMNEDKTFFGRYRFTCPNCGHKINSKFNRNTLIRDAIKIVNLKKREIFTEE